MIKFSTTTEKCLLQSGWNPERSVDAAGYKEQLESEGYLVDTVILEFLTRFGGLYVEHPHAKVPGAIDHFSLNPVEAADSICYERVATYEERVGEKLCVVGEAFRRHMVLMMSSSGVVYAAYDDTLVRVGNSGQDALEALCTGRELEHVP